MKKLYILTFLSLMLGIASSFAQQWRVYDASVLPLQTAAAGMPLTFNVSQDQIGANFVEALMDDPEMSGNKIFRYFQPDAKMATDATKSANRMYSNSFPTAWKDSSFTIIARIKGCNNDTIDRAFDIQWRNGNAKSRDELRIWPKDSTLELEKVGAGLVVKVQADLNAWHVYRIAVNGDSSSVFVDEDPVPAIAGRSTASTSDLYIKVGDGDAARIGGFVDWLAIDTSFSYAPGEGNAIPDSLSVSFGTGSGEGFGKKVIFITQKTQRSIDGTFADSMYVLDLKKAGFDVALPTYSDMQTIDTDEKKRMLRDADAIIIGRGSASGDFDDADDIFWEKVQVPIILLSNNHARASIMHWFPTTTTMDVARFGSLQGKVMNPGDPVFSGVNVPAADSIIPYLSNNMGMLVVANDVLSRVHGDVLVSLIHGPTAYKIASSGATAGDTTATIDLATYTGNPLMVRFAPMDSMYTGIFSSKAAAFPLGWRTYMVAGDDHDWDDVAAKRKLAYYVWSQEMNQVLINELLFLMHQEVPQLSGDNNLDTLYVSAGTLSPAFSPATTNYALEVPEGTTSIQIGAVVSDPKSTLEGAGTFSSIPGTAVVKVTAEDGTPKNYSIVVSVEVVLEDTTIVKPGTGTLETAINEAADGDTLILANNEVYAILDQLHINKKLTIMAKVIDTLPALDDLPVIENTFTLTSVFILEDNCDLNLIGIGVDGGSGSYIFSPAVDTATTYSLRINRCRLYNTTDNILHQTADLDVRQNLLKTLVVQNSFIYNSGVGHAFYTKNYRGGVNEYIFENITYWNIGQQFNWMRSFPSTATQKYTYNHLTGYNISSDPTNSKELFGNSDTEGEAALDITVKNSIFHTQPAANTNDGSFKFNNTSGRHTIEIHDNVMFNIKPIVDLGGTITKSNNLEVDPQFADPDNADFTVGNTDLYAMGDDGEIVGAVYWKPGFVDDFSDLVTEPSAVWIYPDRKVSFTSYPNPFTGYTNIGFTLESAATVRIAIIDITGRLVESLNQPDLGSGDHTVQFDMRRFAPGLYVVKLQINGATGYQKIQKVE